MTRVSFESFLGVLLTVALVNGLPLSVERRDVTKDKAVREMYELLHARRQADGSEQASTETAQPSTVSPDQVDEYKYQSSGESSLVQLCTDAVTFLSSGDSDHEKRNLVINHVYNLCIRPGSNYDVIGLMRDLQGIAKEEDWSNWPGFDLSMTTTNVPTTADVWEQLLNEFFNVDIIGEQDSNGVTTSAPSLYSTMESLDALLSDFISMLEGEYGEVTTARITPSESSGLETSLEEFLHLLEEEEAQKSHGNGITPTTPRPTTGVASSTTIDFEAAFNNFWNMIEELEEEGTGSTTSQTTTGAEPSTTPQATTGVKSSTTVDWEGVFWNLIEELENEDAGASSTTPQATTVAKSTTTIDVEGVFNDFWNMIDGQGEGNDPGSDVVVTSSAPSTYDNQLPPIDMSKRNGMKKRLLEMLAKTLAEKDAMRK